MSALPNEVIQKVKSMARNHENRLDPYSMQIRVINEAASIGVTLNVAQQAALFDMCRAEAFRQERRGNACRRNVEGFTQ